MLQRLLIALGSLIAMLTAGLALAVLIIVRGSGIGPEQAIAESDPIATVIAVGDIMLSREVGRLIRNPPEAEYPFTNIKEYLGTADLVIGNLETPVIEGNLIDAYGMVFRSDPESVDLLKDAGFSAVSLGNNHAHDRGNKGVLRTLELLREKGIAYAGAGKDDAEAFAPAYLTASGLTIGLLAYGDAKLAPHGEAGPENPGMAGMDMGRMRAGVAEAKAKADVVLVFLHAGTEYTDVIRPMQREFARAAIDAGATMVIGAHPHVVQEVEVYGGKYILYSLGNFVFDQNWSEETMRGMAARMTFGKEGLRDIVFTPIRIDDKFRPGLAEEPAKSEITARLRLEAIPKSE